jgi:hypothetical protein
MFVLEARSTVPPHATQTNAASANSPYTSSCSCCAARLPTRTGRERAYPDNAASSRSGRCDSESVCSYGISIPPALHVWIDQRETRDGVMSSLKMPRRFREHDLKRWPYVTFNQVSTVRRRIWLAHDNVSMDLRLVVFDADIADQ